MNRTRTNNGYILSKYPNLVSATRLVNTYIYVHFSTKSETLFNS